MNSPLLGPSSGVGKLRPGLTPEVTEPEVTEPLAGGDGPGRLVFAILNVRGTTASASARLARPWGPAALGSPPLRVSPSPRPGAWAGTLPSRNVFPAAALVARGNRRPARGPARRQLQGTAPGSAAVPRRSLPRLHPGATSAPPPCPVCACAPGPTAQGRPLTWASARTGRRQWEGGASRSPRPSVPRPLEGPSPRACASPSGRRRRTAPAGPRAVHTCARWGPNGARELSSLAGRKAAGASGCTHRPPGWSEENERTGQIFPFYGQMQVSDQIPAVPREGRGLHMGR